MQVTSQILTALIEKLPKDLELYGYGVLRILDKILKSEDIDMVEATVPAWQAYCKHQKTLTLNGDRALSKGHLYMLWSYADFGSDTYWQSKKPTPTKPMLIRWKKVSIQAIKAAGGSECLSANRSTQLEVIIPAILETIYSDGEDNLSYLQGKVELSEKVDMDSARRRRMSMVTVATVDTVDADPASASGTAEDADRVAEEEVRVLAVSALKQIFATGNEYSMTRSHIRKATALTLRFIVNKNPPAVTLDKSDPPKKQGNWATSLIEAITEWTPMAERYAIITTATEILVRCPLTERKLEMQSTLSAIIGWLLSSPVIFFGLSPMDILLGFIHHILKILQPNSRQPSPYRPGIDVWQEATDLFDDEDWNPLGPQTNAYYGLRDNLVHQLRLAITDLATHSYYSGQLQDMIGALQARLVDLPGASPETRETGREAVQAIMGIANRHEKTETFSIRIRF